MEDGRREASWSAAALCRFRRTQRFRPVSKAPEGWRSPKTWRLKLTLLAGFSILYLSFCLPAWGQQYSINWSKIAGGGGTSAGGAYQVSGTIGQHDAAGPVTGGNYSLTGGFWSIISVVQTPGTPRLTVAFSFHPPTVTVYWPASATNYVLQQNSDLTTVNWTPVGLPITTNGSTLSVTVSPPAGNLFFRLKQ